LDLTGSVRVRERDTRPGRRTKASSAICSDWTTTTSGRCATTEWS